MDENKLKHIVDIHGVVRQVKEKKVLTEEEYIAEQTRLREEREKKTISLPPEEYEEWLKTKGGRGVPKDQTQEEAIKQRKGEAVTSVKKKPQKLYSTLEQKRIAEEKRLARLQAEQEEYESEKKEQPTNTHEDLLDEALLKDKEVKKDFFEEFRFLLIVLAIIVAVPSLFNILDINETKEVDLIPQNTVNVQEDLTENAVGVLGFIVETILGVFSNLIGIVKDILNLFL